MNLKYYLLSRIVFVAFICWLAMSAYIVYQTEQQSQYDTQAAAESITRQLQMQLLFINAGYGQLKRFPDFDLWQENSSVPGICIRFTRPEFTVIRSICNGTKIYAKNPPILFEKIYRGFFNPDFEIVRSISFNGQNYGSIIVAPGIELRLARSWEKLRDLMGLSALTIFTVCLLVYMTINRALHPAQEIVAVLEKMQKGRLSIRLPDYNLIEWQRTGSAINQLAVSQEKLLSERRNLTLKLIKTQEEERRILAQSA